MFQLVTGLMKKNTSLSRAHPPVTTAGSSAGWASPHALLCFQLFFTFITSKNGRTFSQRYRTVIVYQFMYQLIQFAVFKTFQEPEKHTYRVLWVQPELTVTELSFKWQLKLHLGSPRDDFPNNYFTLTIKSFLKILKVLFP